MELSVTDGNGSFKLTKNGATDINIYFYKKGLINITRPTISYIKVDTASNTKPVYHIGSKDPMGHTGSMKTAAGVIMFEVLDGYPLQSLMFSLNKSKKGVHYNSLEDLPPLDLYVVQKNGADPYGDYIIKDVKFISTQLELGIKTPGRYVVARFTATCSERFRAPFFFNNFVSDNYDFHIVRNKIEIEQIKADIDNSENNNHYDDKTRRSLNKLLEVYTYDQKKPSTIDLKVSLDKCYNCFKTSYLYGTVGIIADNAYILQISDFIREFYKIRNRYMLKTVGLVTNPGFLYSTQEV